MFYPAARPDQPIARQIIRRLLWALRRNVHCADRHALCQRIRCLWGAR